jgi:hypothetical protein
VDCRGYALGLSILAAVVLASGPYFVPQTITYYKPRPMLLRPIDAPPRGWSSVPRPLADTTVSTGDGATISYFGLRFEVPWKGIDTERNQGCTVEIVFKSRQAVRLSNPDCLDRNPIGSYTSHLSQEDLRLALGTGVRESKYDQYKAVISTTPLQLSPFQSHREFARTQVLLEIKGLWFEHSPEVPEIFSFATFATKDYRGFEINGLSEEGQKVALELFDRTDRHWFTISIVGRGAILTQPEINRLINSFSTTSSSSLTVC